MSFLIALVAGHFFPVFFVITGLALLVSSDSLGVSFLSKGISFRLDRLCDGCFGIIVEQVQGLLTILRVVVVSGSEIIL